MTPLAGAEVNLIRPAISLPANVLRASSRLRMAGKVKSVRANLSGNPQFDVRNPVTVLSPTVSDPSLNLIASSFKLVG